MNTPKMYVLVRRDLAETYRVVQGSHAIVEYALRGDQERFKEWNNGTVLYLGVRNEQALLLWSEKLTDHEKRFCPWHEPDLHGQMTAIACIDDGWIFRKLNMA